MDTLIYIIIFFAGAILYAAFTSKAKDAKKELQETKAGKLILLVKALLLTGVLLFVVGLVLTIPTYGLALPLFLITSTLLIALAFIIYLTTISVHVLMRRK